MASKDTKMNKQGATGKRKHITLRIPQKLENIEGNLDAPKPAADGDIQMEYSSH
jgi:hypothetical protein